MNLASLGGGTGWMKAGFLGFAGSGKTYTAALLSCGLRQHLKLAGPVAMLDTEGGAPYVAARIKEATGQDLVGVQTRALSDAVEFLRECEKGGVSVAILDSVTHLWRELCDSYLKQVNEARARTNRPERTRLEFQDWGPIKAKWGTFSDLYLNSRLHVIICGRAGYDYDYQQLSDDGKKELVKTGIKMKTEGEFGYEPSLLVEMERSQLDDAGQLGPIRRQATVLKDRFGVLDGKECWNPTFEFFRPHVDLLTPGATATVATELKTPHNVDEAGDAEWQRERKKRAIFSEEIQGVLLAAFPGQSAPEKRAKQEAVHRVFGTYSWTAVESMRSDQLKAGLADLPHIVEKIRADVVNGVGETIKPEKKGASK